MKGGNILKSSAQKNRKEKREGKKPKYVCLLWFIY